MTNDHNRGEHNHKEQDHTHGDHDDHAHDHVHNQTDGANNHADLHSHDEVVADPLGESEAGSSEKDSQGITKTAPKKRKKQQTEVMRRFREIQHEKDAEEIKVPANEERKKAMDRLMHIRDKLNTLAWDLDHGQINPAKKLEYEKLKKEFQELEHKVR